MASRLALAAALAALVGCGGVGKDGDEPDASVADPVRRALYESCNYDDAPCGCAEYCEQSVMGGTCMPGGSRVEGAACHWVGTCHEGNCCDCNDDSWSCTRMTCPVSETECAFVVDCPPPDGCWVDGRCDETTGSCIWTYRGESQPCGTGSWCSGGQCRLGCLILGQFFAQGEPRPGNACMRCDAYADAQGWTELADGSGCGTGKVCASAACVDGCLIEAGRWSVGDHNPANECEACTALHPDHWVQTTDFCSDDGDPCTLDRCAAGSCTHPPNPDACRPATTDSMFGCTTGSGAGLLSILLAVALASRRWRWSGPALAAALLAAPAAAAPEVAAPPGARPALPLASPDAVAIVTFEAGAGISAQTAQFVTQALGARLHLRGVPTISQEDVRAALGFERERELLGAACDTQGCFAQLGGALGVRKIVTGSLARLGDSLVLDAQVVDTRGGGVPRRFSVRRPGSRGDDAFLEAIPELVEALFPKEEAARERPLAVAAGGWLEARRDLGAAGWLQVRWSFTSSLRASAGLIAAPHRVGGAARLGWIPWNAAGRVHPVVSLELLALSAEPVSPGVGASVGVEWRATPRLDLGIELPVVRLFAVVDGMRETYLFAAATIAWRT